MSHWVDLWQQIRHRRGKDSRKEPRIATQNAILVCGLDAKGHFYAEENTTVNVSPSGCCFRSISQPMPDTVVSIKSRSASETAAVRGLFQVIWTKEEAGTILVGANRIDIRHE